MRGIHVKLLALLLMLCGLSICWFKVTRLGLPLVPTEKANVWTIEARIEFKARNDAAVKTRFAIPRQPSGFTVVDETFVSGDYGLTTEDDGTNRAVEWAVRQVSGYQVLYYRIHLSRDPAVLPGPSGLVPKPDLRAPVFPEALQSAARGLIGEAIKKSADGESFIKELLLRLNSPVADPNVTLLRQGMTDDESWIQLISDLLTSAGFSSRPSQILVLKDGINHGSLSSWLQVFDGRQWVWVDPYTAEIGLPGGAVPWHVGPDPVLTVAGGRNVKLEFSISQREQDRTLVAEQRARQMGSRLMDLSLFSLPVSVQNVYRILLMVPVGAFLIVILRNVIGIRTFGTFMPILISLSFRETGLLLGMILFSLLIFLGLLIRFYLEYLELLMVPRLAAVLIIVIILMAFISVLSHKLGFDRGLSVALFPMVILAMTIERMSLVWEELGAAEALIQGVGSLAVAALGYLCISSRYLEHLVFVFPELLLVILAWTLLLGRYTGYRLTELWRFRSSLKG